MHEPGHLKPYLAVIRETFSEAEKDSSAWLLDDERNVPQVVVRLAHKLRAFILQEEGREIEIEQILRVESSACGHVDYANKLAQYVFELAVTATEDRQRRVRAEISGKTRL